MKKHLLFILYISMIIFNIYAGDAAVFVDGGFSADGSVYVFGQYGKIDKKFQGWAEIYAVDVKKNDYITNEVFITKPTAVTQNKTGKEVYESLYAQSYFKLKKYDYKNALPDDILYLMEDESKKGTEEIVFKDFTGSINDDQSMYYVQLVPTVKGSGKSLTSSFYINLEKKDAEGNVIASQKIGTPSINRKGVTNYRIEKIVCDKKSKNIVFIVEKTILDDTGVNIRYMIETATLNSDFDKKIEVIEAK